MPITSFTIDGEEVNPLVESLSIRESAVGVSTLSCRINSEGVSPAYRPRLHAPIYAEEDGEAIFGGTITQIDEEGLDGQPNLRNEDNDQPYLTVQITAEDYSSLLDRRYITLTVDSATSPAPTLSAVLQQLVDDYYTDYGVTLHGSQATGPTLPTMTFTLTRGSDVIKALSDATGYIGGIGYDKTLRMWAPGDLTAPFDPNESDDPAKWTGDVKVERRLGDEYANKVIVLGPDIDDPNHYQTWTSTGSETVFDLDYTFVAFPDHVIKVITPTLAALGDHDWETITFEEADVARWYVDPVANTITRYSSPDSLPQTPEALPSGTIIKWLYHGKTTPRGEAEDAGEIAANGLTEYVHRDDSVTSDADADALAAQILAQRLEAGDLTVRYTTRYTAPTLRAGQTQTITAPSRDVSGTHLITDISVRSETPATSTYAAAGLGLIRSVTATRSQTLLSHWKRTYNDWLGGAGKTVVQSNTDGAKDIVSDLLAGYILKGSGHPQGVREAPVGSRYLDIDTGYWYRKTGGGSTAYGWYYEAALGGVTGPIVYYFSATDQSAGQPGVQGGFTTLGNTNLFAASSFADGWYDEARSNTSTGTNGGWNTATFPYWIDTDFDLVGRFRTGSTLTASRIWFALFSTIATNSDDNGGLAIGFRYSTGVPDGGWVGYTRDGSNSSVTSTVASITTDTRYDLRVRFVRTGTPTVYFSVNDGTEISKTNHIPATGTRMLLQWNILNRVGTAQTMFYKRVVLASGPFS